MLSFFFFFLGLLNFILAGISYWKNPLILWSLTVFFRFEFIPMAHPFWVSVWMLHILGGIPWSPSSAWSLVSPLTPEKAISTRSVEVPPCTCVVQLSAKKLPAKPTPTLCRSRPLGTLPGRFQPLQPRTQICLLSRLSLCLGSISLPHNEKVPQDDSWSSHALSSCFLAL